MEYIIGSLKFLGVLAFFLFVTYLWMLVADRIGTILGLKRFITWILEKLQKET